MTNYTFQSLFTFTRTTAATFVGSNGLIQTTPASVNLLLQSQALEITWSRGNILAFGSGSVIDAIAAPDGTTTAEFIVPDTTGGVAHFMAQSVTHTAASYTISAYVKAGAYSKFAFRENTTAGNYATFNIGTGAVIETNATASIQNAGNGWYRCTLTYTGAAVSQTMGLYVLPASYTSGSPHLFFWAGDGTSGLYMWGVQDELGSTATTYTRNNGGVYPARFDYDPATLQPKGILIEEQRVNLLTYSEQFNDVSWIKARVSITANATASPDGTISADKLVEDTATNTHVAFKASGIASGTHTLSVYAKADTRGWLCFETDTLNTRAFFNIATGVLGTIGSAVTATITNAGNGWYRCTITGAFLGNIYLAPASANNVVNYTGDGTSGIFIWGAQVEAGAFATSYIPTVASTVTRAADVCTITAPLFAPWYNATQGTFVVKANVFAIASQNVFNANDGSGANRIVHFAVNTSSQYTVTASSVDQVLLQPGTILTNAVYNFASAYAANNFAASIGGGAVVSDTSGSVPTGLNKLSIGTSAAATAGYLNGHIQSIQYYPVRLADFQLQALTT